MHIHSELLKYGMLQEGSSEADILVSLYAKCGYLTRGMDLLVELTVRDVFSWTDLMAGYLKHGQGELTLQCFKWMLHEDLIPDSVTFCCILEACGTLRDIETGLQIHEEIVKQRLLEGNVVLGTALVDMYAKCGVFQKAQEVLDQLPEQDVFCWTAIITGLAQHGQSRDALICFKMMESKGISPDSMTFASILKACGDMSALDMGEWIHSEIIKEGILDHDIVLGTALIDMYCKCGSFDRGHGLLQELPAHDSFSWTAFISCAADQGFGEESLRCFEQMQQQGIRPDVVTWASILKACGSIGAATRGEEIHNEIERRGLLQDNVLLLNAVVHMYAKCGALEKSQQVFEKLPVQEVVTWNALITGYAQKGSSQNAFKCLQRMEQKGLPPDLVTYLCLLNVCSHSGLLDEGQVLFTFLSSWTTTVADPCLEHYTCMVDLFGRAGNLDKASAMVEVIPSLDFIGIWVALLFACQKWADVTLGKRAFEHSLEVAKSDMSAYVLMRNIYSYAGMLEEAEEVEIMRMKMCRP
ncbi:hypothetical protein KP509_22G042200 [Ceratopteris richardii]|nr:hypothetical protein KP509_22G042200 [Ceratopteris richardii]